jgi:stage II sporulation protein D
LFEDDTVHTLPLEEYLRGVVPSEMPALWPGEAIKAQAVAARSYAHRAIAHPRHPPRADICTTPHCQRYTPTKIHANSDEAIRLTQNRVLLYEGRTINAVFSARCGGHTRSNDEVWPGQPLPYLRGVPCPDQGARQGHGVGLCQHGARILATQGRTYDEILKHYYHSTTLGSIR